MFNQFFSFLENINYKYYKFFNKIEHTGKIASCFRFIKFHLVRKQNNINFYANNADRINAIVNMLADEKSKKTYLAMIKFRQTRNKEDFPFSNNNEIPYFTKEIVSRFSKDEVFIDCGAYNGDTIDDFLKYCSEYKQVIAFEPLSENVEEIKKKYVKNSKITLINAGVYDKDDVVNFIGGGCGGRIFKTKNDEKNVKIQVKAIDNLNIESVTFIKMDVEGAELNALKGAEKTIIRDKPKLAICLYHSNEDMLSIAEYINKIVPEYKLYVAHYGPYPVFEGTVLYAILP